MTGVYYSQNNDSRWKSIVYSKTDKTRTIGTSGCGITSPAMVFSTLLKKEIFPPEIATFSLNNGYRIEGVGTSYSLYPALATKYDLQFERTTDVNKLVTMLKSGWMACMGCSRGNTKIFSTSGHIIALMGISDDGRIIVHDPYLYNGKFNSSYRAPYVEYNKMDLINGMDILISPDKLQEQLNTSGGYNCYHLKNTDNTGNAGNTSNTGNTINTSTNSNIVSDSKIKGLGIVESYKVNVNSTLRVRSDKSTTSKVLGSLNNNATVDVLEIIGDWAVIYYSGQIAYVSKQYLTPFNPKDLLISDLKLQIRKLERKVDALEGELNR